LLGNGRRFGPCRRLQEKREAELDALSQLQSLRRNSTTPQRERMAVRADVEALEAHLFAPSRTVGFVQPGQSVFIRYAAYPFQKFGMYSGRITAVSGTPFFPNELPPNLSQQLLSQAGSVEGLYRISVALDDQAIRAYGAPIPLKPGFVLEADVIQARLKIWEMMFEPLLAIRASMTTSLARPAGAGGAAP
jgi:hypothetical protein